MSQNAVEKRLPATKSIDKERRTSRPSSSPRSGRDAVRKALLADRIDAGEVDLQEVKPTDSIDLDAYESIPTINLDDDDDDDDLDEEERAKYNVKHPTGDRMRDKVRKLLADAMDKPDEKVKPRPDIENIANAIEEQMFDKFKRQAGPLYKAKYRDLNFNLKDIKNKSLRTNVLTKRIKLEDLLTMSNQDLANDELKTKRKKVQEKMTRDAQPSTKLTATTSMFKCGKCKKRKCTYFQMQTRSADEPLTTFVTCANCNNRWKFS